MKVKELIKQLKNMPQDADVGFSHSDAGESLIDGWIFGVSLRKRREYENDKDLGDDMPGEWVALTD